jgi:vitamin B12 transporter
VSGSHGRVRLRRLARRREERRRLGGPPGDAFGTFNPDDDGFSRKSGSLRLGWTPAAGHRSASACSRPASIRSTTRPSSTPSSIPIPRPTSAPA